MKCQIALIIIAIIGLVSSIMALKDYNSQRPMCKLGKVWDCESVYHIPQARIFGIHLSYVALIYFVVLLLMTLIYAFLNNSSILLSIIILSVGGTILVPYLIYLEARVAHAFCLYCTIMHAMIILNALLSTYFYVSKLKGI